MLIGTYSTSAATETTIPIFLSSLTNSHLLYGTSIPHCVTHKTDFRNVFVNQHSVIKRKKSEKLSEAERIIQDLDIDNLSPMQAFTVLADLSEKVKNKNL